MATTFDVATSQTFWTREENTNMNFGDSGDSNDSMEMPQGILQELDMQDSSQSYDVSSQMSYGGTPTHMMNGDINNHSSPMVNGFNGHVDPNEPCLVITEQPQSRGFRFRYKCEGGSHGGLQGVRSERGKKTFPTVMIKNYKGPARIVVTLVTDEQTPKTHAHELVGKNCQDGICVVEMKEHTNMTATFPNIGVQHVTKKNLVNVLTQRIGESIRLGRVMETGDNGFQLPDVDLERARQQAQEQAKTMGLSSVRLCFQAYLMDDNGHFSRMLQSVISNPIYDCKAPGAAALKICRMDKQAGCCTGNEEVFLLCDKVQKDDIAVRFYEEDDEGNVKWEAFGNFGPPDVHRQYAIVFKTPAYYNTQIAKPVVVRLQLMRRSDKETSDHKPFTFYPRLDDKDEVGRKRKKSIWGSGYSGGYSGGYGGSGGYSGGGGGVGGFNFGGGTGGFTGFTAGGTQQGGVNQPPTTSTTRPMMPVQQQQLQQPQQQLYAPQQQAQFIPQQQFQQNMSYTGSFTSYQLPNNQVPQVSGYMQNTPYLMPSTGLMTDSAPLDEGELAALTLDDPLASPDDMPLKKRGFKKETTSFTSTQTLKSQSKREIKTESFKETPSPTITEPVKIPPSTPQEMPQMMSTSPEAEIAIKIAERTAYALQEYSMTGDIRALLALQRHLVAVQDESGDTCLHLSIIHNQPEACHNILSVAVTIPNNNVVNQRNHLHQTALHLAVITSQPLLVDLLLKSGADPYLQDRNGNTAAHLAAEQGDEKCMEALFRYVRMGTTQNNPFPELNILNYNGFAPVHLAIFSGSLPCLKVLVRSNANVDLPDGKSGRTALHHAVEEEHLSLAGHLILEAGASVNAQTFDGNTPLHVSVGRGLTGMTALLMTAGGDPTLENSELKSYEEADETFEETNEEEERPNLDMAMDLDEDLIGHNSFDLAEGNEKIMKILNGEPYATANKANRPGNHLGQHSLDILGSSLKDSGFETGPGDLEKVDLMTRVSISKLLDPPDPKKDWVALANKLGLENLVGAFRLQKSPTLSLLDNYEVIDGTIAEFRQALLDIDRKDAVSILDKGRVDLTPGTKMPQSTDTKDGTDTDKPDNHKKHLLSDKGHELEHTRLDSGFGSSLTGHS